MSPLLIKAQEKIWNLGARIGLEKTDLMICTSPIGDGTPHFEIHNDEYHCVSSERGFEFSRNITKSMDEFLYWFFKDKISSLSVKYELEHRVRNQDFRKVVFAKEVELFNFLDPLWGIKAKDDIQKILEVYPYSDN